MSRYDHINPMDIDPDTGRPYANYSTDSLDTSFHDGEMDDDDDDDRCTACGRISLDCSLNPCEEVIEDRET